MTDTPFYTCGLKFSCKRCSACCRYDSGTVWLSEKDIEKLTARTQLQKTSFIKTYCRWVADGNGNEILSLKEKSNNDCIFWDGGCTVYDQRPLQCITFPFWKDIVSSAGAWEIAASGCPGMNTGKVHPAEEIEKYVAMRAAQPIINRQGEL
jgi:Fe-S-cluster containining protein